jgi:Dolichyl-phosphate-mannose-protein mannosyltransferase
MTPGGLAAALRRNWLFAILLVAGLVLRVLTQVAYRPALLYIDSIKYLFGAYPGNHPPGYQLMLKLFLRVGTLPMVAVLQHLLGLAMAVALYLILRRRGVARWLAALATAPILLDAYQLQVEQSIMPDTAFETLIVAGLVFLLWKPRPRTWMVLAAGLALGASATVRQIGEIFVLPAVIFVLIVMPGWRDKLIKAVALVAAFALPVVLVSFRNYVSIKHFSLAPYAAGTVYGRAAAAADCATLKLPSYERSLCPTHRQQLLGPDWLNHGGGSPIKHIAPPPGMRHISFAVDFSRRVMLQQPLRVAAAIGKDALKLFSLQRVTYPGDVTITRWQFQGTCPLYPPYITMQAGQLHFNRLTPAGRVKLIAQGQRFGGGEPAASAGLAAFLRAYQLNGGYTPGPLFLLSVLAGLVGSIGVLRRRASPAQRATAAACLLTFLSAAAVLLASDAFGFSWRYQLPALVTLPPAGALGITVVIGYLAARRTAAEGPRARGLTAGAGPEPGRGDPHDQGQRDEDHHWEQGRDVAGDHGRRDRAHDQGDEDAQAAAQAIGDLPRRE